MTDYHITELPTDLQEIVLALFVSWEKSEGERCE